MASGLPCIVSKACGCVEDLVEPIRPDLSFPVGDVGALERAMAAVISRQPDPDLLRVHIAKYDVTQTIDTVERLYFSARGESATPDPKIVQ